MKKLLIVAVIFSAAFASCQGSKSAKSFSDIDSLSYSIGVDMANSIRGLEDSTLNASVVAAAIRDMFNSKPQISHEDAIAFLQQWFQVRVPARQIAESQAWLDEVKAGNPNIQITASGLMYEIINAGDQSVKAVNDADQVVVKYRGTLSDGTEFDSNDSIAIALNRVIPAWTEGMKLIGKGGEMVMWVPSELGYGQQGGGPIPGNAALKFEVTLHDVIPATPVE